MTQLTEKSLWFSLSLLLLAGGLVFITVNATPAPVQEVQAPLDSASVLTTSTPIERVVLGNEEVARVQVVSSRQILIFGKQTGRSTLHVWSENGLQKYLLRVRKLSSESGSEIFSALDQEDTGDKELRVFSPQYREVSEFETYLNELLQDRGEVVLSDAAASKIFVVAPPDILDKVERLLDRVDVPGEDTKYTRRVQLENRPVNEMKQKVIDMLSEDGKVIIDEETNSLMLVDNVDKVQEVVNFLDQIDVRTVAQVRIEAKFVEMSDEAEKQIGIDWDYSGSVDGREVSGHMVPSLSDYNAPGASPASGGMQLDLVQGAQNIGARMHYLESEGLANLISSPNVVTRNQQEATLKIQNEKSYVADYQTTSTDGAIEVTPQIETLTDGITLKATPLIGQGDIIQLQIEPELKIARLGEGQATSNGKIYTPTTDVRKATLNVALKDGQTLVIGGLNKESTSESSDEVPLLGKIPLIGGLFFSQDSKSKENRKISIFLTADIVRLTEDNQGQSALAPDTGSATDTSVISTDTVPSGISFSDTTAEMD